MFYQIYYKELGEFLQMINLGFLEFIGEKNFIVKNGYLK